MSVTAESPAVEISEMIVRTPGILGGKPRLRGRRVGVHRVAGGNDRMSSPRIGEPNDIQEIRFVEFLDNIATRHTIIYQDGFVCSFRVMDLDHQWAGVGAKPLSKTDVHILKKLIKESSLSPALGDTVPKDKVILCKAIDSPNILFLSKDRVGDDLRNALEALGTTFTRTRDSL